MNIFVFINFCFQLCHLIVTGKPFKDKPEAKKPVPEIPIEIPKFNPNLFKIPKEKPKPIVRALPPEHDPKYRNTIFGSDVYYRRKKKLDF